MKAFGILLWVAFAICARAGNLYYDEPSLPWEEIVKRAKAEVESTERIIEIDQRKPSRGDISGSWVAQPDTGGPSVKFSITTEPNGAIIGVGVDSGCFGPSAIKIEGSYRDGVVTLVCRDYIFTLFPRLGLDSPIITLRYKVTEYGGGVALRELPLAVGDLEIARSYYQVPRVEYEQLNEIFRRQLALRRENGGFNWASVILPLAGMVFVALSPIFSKKIQSLTMRWSQDG